MKILTANQFREIDRLTSEHYGISQLSLMERAGTCVVETMEEAFDDLKDLGIVILCGKGNNGGDGFVVARLLLDKGCVPSVYIVGSADDIRGEAAANLLQLRGMGCTPQSLLSISMLAPELKTADIIVDALLGTGLTRPAEGLLASVIEAIADTEASVVSIDVPSGLAADQPEIIGPCIDADLTVTFTALKSCLVFPPASRHAGDVVVVDIGNPDALVNAPEHQLNLLTEEDFPGALHARSETSHKGDYGKVLIVGGSRGKSGAAVMAGQAALRAGAGLVTVATAASVLPIVAASMPELMTEPLDETDAGSIAGTAPGSEILAGRTILGIGPGIGTHPKTQSFVRQTIHDARIPTVVDADGLNAFIGHTDALMGSDQRPLVITPHPGEMSRLIDKDAAHVNAYRVEVARDFAVNHHLYVVLKGFRTVIAAPDGAVYINSTGNPGMATGGMGDILTGMIAGILAQEGLGPFVERVCLAVYLHGLAGDLAAETIGEESLVATDLLRHIGEAWKQIREP